MGDVAEEKDVFHQRATWRNRRKAIVRLRFSIQAYALLVVYVAAFTSLYKLIPWAIRTYQP
jgi:hypothetical protein